MKDNAAVTLEKGGPERMVTSQDACTDESGTGTLSAQGKVLAA